MSVNQRAHCQLVQDQQRAWGSNTRYQNPLILIPAPSRFLSSVSLIPTLQYLILFGFLTSELKYFFTCIVDCKYVYFNLLCLLNYLACPVFFLSSRRVFIPSCLLSLSLLLGLCGFISFWILFLDYFNGCSSGIRKRWVHGLFFRFKWKSPRRGAGVVVALTNAVQTWGDIHK